MSNKFVHTHLHTEFSTLDGINRVDTLPTYIRDTLGQDTVSITDHGTMAGSYKFFKSCNKAGVKPIIGMEAYYAVGDRTVREADHLGSRYHHMVLLAKNNTGLHNLYKLSTASFTTGMYYKPRIDDTLLADLSEGLMATSACLGSYSSQLILRGENAAAEKLLDHHAAMFKDNFFIEVQLHADKQQQTVNKVLLDIAKRKNYPLLLSNDCHYTHESDKDLHEQSLCMQTGAVMSDPPYNHDIAKDIKQGKTRFSFGEIDVHVAHHDWMWKHAQAQGIPYEAISNTVALGASVASDDYFSDRRNRYPKFQGLPEGMPPWTALNKLAHKQLLKKFSGSPPPGYIDRLNSELKVIKKMGFYDYLLIVKQFLDGARELDVLVGPGRGSVAGSLVAFVLEITEIDPIKYGLVFERWLNIGRAARPMLIPRAMMKQIKEAEDNGSRNTHTCGTHDSSNRSNPVPDVRPVLIQLPRIPDLPKLEVPEESVKERAIEYPKLGLNLLKCFKQGKKLQG